MQSGEVRPEDEDAFHTRHLIAENSEVYQRIVGLWGQVDSVELVPARKPMETVLVNPYRTLSLENFHS
jgi:hypothetical protein